MSALPGRGWLTSLCLLVLPPLALSVYAWSVYSRYHIEEPVRLGPEARAEAVRILRAALESDRADASPRHPELQRALANRGPVIVSLWLDGRAAGRVGAHGDSAGAALAEAARTLATGAEFASLRADRDRAARTRIKVDIAVGRKPLHSGTLRAFSVNPGKEGLGVRLDGERDVVLLPDELADRQLLRVRRPIAFIKDLRFGLDFEQSDFHLAKLAKLPAGNYATADKTYFRFRTDTFVEAPVGQRDRAPIQLIRGLPAAPEVTAQNLRAAALSGARYLIAHLSPKGRYQYEVDLVAGTGTDPSTPGPYSIPRHAGTTYFLAETYRITGEEFLREPIERAFGHLAELVRAGGCNGQTADGRPFACVIDRGQKRASLGSTALAVVALAEYRRATQDPRYDELMNALTEWILLMQRSDGSFRHFYDVPSSAPDDVSMTLYFSGEAALALARMHVVTGDPRYLRAVAAGLDWLVDWYDFFVGGFFFGEEHWTCIASEAAWPALKRDRYREFCDDYGSFLRRQQPVEGENPGQDDLAGAYSFTPFVVPNNTPAGSRSEAMISAYLLGKHHGRPNPEVRAQVLRAMKFALRQQISDDSAWNAPADLSPVGGMTASGINRTVRIDYVQHVCSAMIRSIELLEE